MARWTGNAWRFGRGAILLSSLIFPGLGQLAQKRWLAAIITAGTFMLVFSLFVFRSCEAILEFYRLGLEGLSPENVPSIWGIVGLFVLCIVIYLANVYDVFLAHRRIATRMAIQRHFGVQCSEEEQRSDTGLKK